MTTKGNGQEEVEKTQVINKNIVNLDSVQICVKRIISDSKPLENCTKGGQGRSKSSGERELTSESRFQSHE